MDKKFDPYPDDKMSKEDVKKLRNWEKEEIMVYKYLEVLEDKTSTFEQLFNDIKDDYLKIVNPDWIGIGLNAINAFLKGIDEFNFKQLLNLMVRRGRIRAEKSGGKIRYFIE